MHIWKAGLCVCVCVCVCVLLVESFVTPPNPLFHFSLCTHFDIDTINSKFSTRDVHTHSAPHYR